MLHLTPKPKMQRLTRRLSVLQPLHCLGAFVIAAAAASVPMATQASALSLVVPACTLLSPADAVRIFGTESSLQGGTESAGLSECQWQVVRGGKRKTLRISKMTFEVFGPSGQTALQVLNRDIKTLQNAGYALEMLSDVGDAAWLLVQQQPESIEMGVAAGNVHASIMTEGFSKEEALAVAKTVAGRMLL